MKIYLFKIEDGKAVGGIGVEDDDKEIKGYVYGYGNDLERDAKEPWFKEIWE